MNNFLSNISFFTARRAEEAPQVNAALPSSAAGGGDGPGADIGRKFTNRTDPF